MVNSVALVITSVAGRDDALTLMRALLTRHLAACVQLLNVESCYHWEGRDVQECECVLHIKTCTDVVDALVAWLQAHHPYDTPEILVLDAKANDQYAGWVSRQCLRRHE